LHGIQSGRDLVVDDVRVLGGSLDVGVIERPLHQFQVPGFPEQLGREVVAEVVKPKVGYGCRSPDTFPGRFKSAVGDRVSRTFYQILMFSGPLGDIVKTISA
jgi:hypothetical protein